MGCVAERAVGNCTEEGWEGMRDGDKGPAGGGSVGGTQTWQTQTLQVCKNRVLGYLLLPSSLTKVSDELQQVVAVCGDDGSGQGWEWGFRASPLGTYENSNTAMTKT